MMYRIYRPSRLWREMDRLQREMNRVFDGFQADRHSTPPSYPAMNIWHSGDDAILTAEVPGVNPEDIDINVVGETLTIRGERKPDQMDDDVRYHRRERGFGQFSRSIRLPFNVEPKAVEATFKNGVLHVTLPRAEADRPRKITVKSA